MSYHADKKVLTAHTDGHTDRQTQATTIPKGQNWPRVKMICIIEKNSEDKCTFIIYAMEQIHFVISKVAV